MANLVLASPLEDTGDAGKKPGFVRRVVAAMTEARERRAERHIATVLALMDDETLQAAGLSRAALLEKARAS